ncbi:MAG: ATP-dependent RecD-like DNA helicase, partial [Oscillospiraceae bacterium]
MSEPEVTLEGTVTTVIFRNEENGYTILRMDTSTGEETTVVGCMPGVAPGEGLKVTGKWGHHPSYGEQLKAEVVERSVPTGVKAIFDYLASRTVKGIGARTARLIVDAFGEDTLRIMGETPDRLTEIKGITPKRARAIGAEFSARMGMRRLLDFLTAQEMPAQLAMPLYRRFGDVALEALKGNPYLLVEDELGVAFSAADALALKLGIGEDEPRRLEAGLVYTLKRHAADGHTFLPEERLMAASAQLLGAERAPLEHALDDLLDRETLVREEIAGETAIYLAALHHAEEYVALRLFEMGHEERLPPKGLPKMLTEIQKEQGITYAPQQVAAVSLAARSQVMLLTGGPGTGKTTSMRGVLALFDALGLETALAAPTGRAAKRLGETCGMEAATIHRLLETRFDSATGALIFAHNQSDPLRVDAVIVDETSMVDITLMAALLEALRSDCRLVLVGDPDQLPSVGPGCLLSDLLRSGAVPAVRLTEVFRQAAESRIVMNAHSVNHGELPPLKNGGGDFFFLRRSDAAATCETIVDLVAHRLPEKMGIPSNQIQVLSPTRKYAAGTRSLNRALQAAVNPPETGKEERPYGDTLYRLGDRVMQVKNNYDAMWTDGGNSGMGIFNGDIGQIVALEDKGGLLTVDFEGRVVDYTPDMLSELEPAYAVTVHKAQGSEYRAVVLAASDAPPMLLTRGVLYTAITRARELLVIVGDDGVLERMTKNNRQQR